MWSDEPLRPREGVAFFVLLLTLMLLAVLA